jgi:DNA repair protein RecO (recombination protein O)
VAGVGSARPRTSRAAPALAAFVLHAYDWSESSLIVELFTRERGRLAVAAKGAKRPTSQLRPVLLPFQRLAVTLGRLPDDSAAELHTLRAAEWGGGLPLLAGGALFRGFYVNELVLKGLARQDPHEALFDAYAMTLPALADDGPGGTAALRAFELLLLQASGVLPALDRVTASQQPLAAGAAYRLDPEGGVVASVLAREGGRAGGDALLDGAVLAALAAALARVADGDPLDALHHACRGAGATALRGALRTLLHYHLGGAALRTRQVLQEVQRLIPPPTERDRR